MLVGWVMGWVGGDGMGHRVGGWGWGWSWVGEWVLVGSVSGWLVVGWVWFGVPMTPPHHGGHQMPPMLFFDNLVKKLDQIVKK